MGRMGRRETERERGRGNTRGSRKEREEAGEMERQCRRTEPEALKFRF